MRSSVGQVTLSYSLKYLRYLVIPLSSSEFIKRNITKPYNNALYIPTITYNLKNWSRNDPKI